jgi:hypothetical protein
MLIEIFMYLMHPYVFEKEKYHRKQKASVKNEKFYQDEYTKK